jgi:hypothetical protein
VLRPSTETTLPSGGQFSVAVDSRTRPAGSLDMDAEARTGGTWAGMQESRASVACESDHLVRDGDMSAGPVFLILTELLQKRWRGLVSPSVHRCS